MDSENNLSQEVQAFDREMDFDLVRNPAQRQSGSFFPYRLAYRQAEQYFRDIIENKNSPWTVNKYLQTCTKMHRIMFSGNWYSKQSLMGKVKGGGLRRRTVPRSGRPYVSDYALAIGGKHQLNCKKGAVAIKRVKQNLPENTEQGEHRYPSGHKDLIPYFRSAVISLNAFMNTSNRDRKLRRLSDFYHTMINARPYTQVNQSLFMNQVNVLLQSIALPPVHHGHLDHLAHRFDYREFRQIFRLHHKGQLGMAKFRKRRFIKLVYSS